MFPLEWMALGELFVTGVVDFLIYVLVDKVVKTPLSDAGDIEEKRVIWLYESIVLLTLSFFIYAFHHTPFTLLSMTIATFVYTQMLGRVNFRQWWMKVTTLFDEFEQHEESMEKLQELKQQQQLAQQANMSSNSNMPRWPPPNPMMSHIPPIMADNQANAMPDFSAPAEAWYPADVEREKMKTASNWPAYSESQGVYSNAPSVVMAAPQLRHRGPPATVSQQYYYPGQTAFYSRLPEKYHNGPRYTPIMPRGSELARRPLHGYSQNQKATVEDPQGKLSFTSKVLSVFGMDPYNKTPPGLPNSGNNLCFMNSVLQCLANCPSLIESLTGIEDLKSCTMPEAVMVTSLRDLLKSLTEKPGTTDVKVVDTKEFRNAISSLPGSIVVNPVMSRQSQQDSAELLMWLLHVLHDALNSTKNQTTNNNGSISGPTHNNPDSPRQLGSPKYTSAKINMLKYIYGDLTIQRIKELKDACRKEIESSNGLEGNSYAEPVQRLSDLEWLTYKEQNNSAIDDLFTGQLVEAQHCTACNRLSVSIQTFNILPVPIVEPRDFNGLVYLDDCLTKFGTIESLYGPDGLRCECSNAQPSTSTERKSIPKPSLPFSPIDNNAKVTVQSPSKRTESPSLPNGGASKDMHRRILANRDSVMSPIPLIRTGDIFNDSGFSDTQFRTSTPIRGQNAPIKLTDGQRRSLLRQLPEYLILQVLRFTYHNGQPRKIHRPISIPLVNLDLTEQIVDKVMKREDLTALNASYKYNLCGLCVHLGGDGNFSGHYVSYSIASDGLWYKFDDESVTPVNMEYELNTKVVRENAYLLFYKKSQGR